MATEEFSSQTPEPLEPLELARWQREEFDHAMRLCSQDIQDGDERDVKDEDPDDGHPVPEVLIC